MNERMVWVALGLTFAGGVALGFGAGHYVTVKRLNEQYDAKLEEELKRTAEFYQRVNKTGDFEDPAKAAEALGLVEEAADAIRKYQGEDDEEVVVARVKDQKVRYDKVTVTKEDLEYEPNPVDVVADEHREAVKRNIWEDHNDDLIFQDRDTSKPYIINDDEWMGNEPNHEQVQLTWYADKVLTDDNEVPIDDLRIVGGHLEHFGIGASDPNVVMVRNEKLHMDYEITRVETLFAHIVAGFTEEIKHSDDNVRRLPRRSERWRDE
jgi:hypothetical protein